MISLQEWVLSAPKEDLHLPAPNIFVPTDLSLKIVQEKVQCVLILRSVNMTISVLILL